MKFRPLHDRILVRRIQLDGEDLLIMKEADAMGIVETDATQMKAA